MTPDDPTPPSAPQSVREVLAGSRHREVLDALERHEATLGAMAASLVELVALERRRVEQADRESTLAIERRRLEIEASRAWWERVGGVAQGRVGAALGGVASTALAVWLARLLGIDLAALAPPPGATHP